MFTKEAVRKMELIKNDFPDLAKHYQPELGNFLFTKLELYSNLADVFRWLEAESTYFLLHQEGFYALTDYK